MYIQPSSLESSKQKETNAKIPAENNVVSKIDDIPFYYYEIKTDHKTTIFLITILISTPIIAWLEYEKITEILGITLPNQSEKMHLEFLLLLNNLSIVNRNRIIFPIVLFTTLFLFTVKIAVKSPDNDNNDKEALNAALLALPKSQ
jgi:hypothetical protein